MSSSRTLRRRAVRSAALFIALLVAGTAVSVPSAAADSNPAPVDGRFPTPEAFVDQAYRDFLSRTPDDAGFAFWSDTLRSGTTPGALIEYLLDSAEFRQTTAPIVRLYHSIFDRTPDLAGLRFWVDRTRAGRPLAETTELMLEGAEFEALTAARSTDEIVAAVYGRSLGRTPDAAGLAYWRGEIEAGRLTLAQFVLAVSESPEHRALQAGEVTVALVYLGMLQRTPDDAGLVYWSDLVESGIPTRALADAFLVAPEYRNRFSPPVRASITEIGGFSHPWDVDTLPDGTVLVTERAGRLTKVVGTTTSAVGIDLTGLFASGETGFMGLAVDPAFATNRRIYTCQGNTSPRDVRVIAWSLDAAVTSATRVGDVVTGIPLGSGRHGGCQLEFHTDGSLWVGTGDAAVGTNPQSSSLGGKVLRVDLTAGPTNATVQIVSRGHRNVQGLSQRPGTDEMWSVEHGPTRDDEINRVQPGGNAGWNPVPGYNESVPMTDLSLPGAYAARYSTGAPTDALSGAEWLDDPAWGAWNGGLMVAALKDQSVRIHFFDDTGRWLGATDSLASGRRLRGVHQAADGTVYLTSSGGNDVLLVVRPVPAG